MDVTTMQALTKAGGYCAMALGAFGSGLGAGIAASAAIGAWKKCYAQERPAPFQLAVFAGAPLTQTIYGMIMMFIINGKAESAYANWPLFLIIGLVGGTAMGVSAWLQGQAAAGACDAFGETSKGFTNNLMAIGIVETVAIFVLAFSLVLITQIA
ncbi:MAG: V-type ATP synthase subunit K [Lentisphaerae bacterium ADurb.BinA184]|nr:MAG: V-type ATP synthase subunit K [Lentisphaerae bacterium ADurb.BinA184]